ncbi:hypothetical protein J7E29_07045 [Streptomyces sp. ISL-90]|nr:hypothetical protein [Streptomyces sp. ISL-90]
MSTTDRGARMTQLPAGRPVGRLSGNLVLRVLVCSATWAVASSVLFTAILGLAPTPQVSQALGSPWALVVALVLGYVAIVQSIGIHAHAKAIFGQAWVAGLLAGLTVTGGHAASAAWWLFASFQTEPMPPFDLRHIASSPEIPRELGAVIGGVFAAWAIFTLCRLPGALHHARSRQRTLERLRRDGTCYEGVLTQVTFSNLWVRDEPFFTVQVSYDAEGETRVVPARMRTCADRVPVVGNRMVVLSDGHGSVSVELDTAAETVFEADGRYRAPEG